MSIEFEGQEEAHSPTGEAEDPAQEEGQEQYQDADEQEGEESSASEDTGEEGEGSPAEGEEPTEHEPPPDSPRFKEVYGKWKQREREVQQKEQEAEFWRQQALQATQQGQQQEAQPEVPPDTPRPKEADFEDYTEFIRAENDWNRNQGKREVLLETQKVQQQQQWQTFREQVIQKSESARKQHGEEWDRVVLQGTAPLSPHIINAAYAMENTGEILYDLASNPSYCRQISQMPPELAGIEIAKINQKHSGPPPVPPRVRSNAPNPIKTVGQGDSAAQTDESKMSDDEHFAYLEKKRLAGRQRGAGVRR